MRTLRFSGVTLIVRATDDEAVATPDSIATAINDLASAGTGEIDVELTEADPDRADGETVEVWEAVEINVDPRQCEVIHD